MNLNSWDDYKKYYKEQLKDMDDKKVLSLLILNVRNQEQKQRKKYPTKAQLEHLEKIGVHIEILKEEIQSRMK